MSEKADRAYELIKEKIFNGTLTSKESISINALSLEMGFSKTPVRDALLRLEVNGFVKIYSRQGVVVRDITLAEVTQMYELRIALEGYLIRRSVDLFREEDFSSLRDILSKQKKAIERNDPSSFIKLDNEGHLYLHKVYYNPIMFDILNHMTDRTYYGGIQALNTQDRMNNALYQHTQLFAAVEARDADKAIEVLKTHFNTGLASAVQIFS